MSPNGIFRHSIPISITCLQRIIEDKQHNSYDQSFYNRLDTSAADSYDWSISLIAYSHYYSIISDSDSNLILQQSYSSLIIIDIQFVYTTITRLLDYATQELVPFQGSQKRNEFNQSYNFYLARSDPRCLKKKSK